MTPSSPMARMPSMSSIQQGGSCHGFNCRASIWQWYTAERPTMYQCSLASLCSNCSRVAGPFLVRQISIARSSASWSTGESGSPSLSVRRVVIFPLQCHPFVIGDRSGLDLRRLPGSAAGADLEPLREAAQLPSGVPVDDEPGANPGAVLAGHHHAVLLQLESG